MRKLKPTTNPPSAASCRATETAQSGWTGAVGHGIFQSRPMPTSNALPKPARGQESSARVRAGFSFRIRSAPSCQGSGVVRELLGRVQLGDANWNVHRIFITNLNFYQFNAVSLLNILHCNIVSAYYPSLSSCQSILMVISYQTLLNRHFLIRNSVLRLPGSPGNSQLPHPATPSQNGKGCFVFNFHLFRLDYGFRRLGSAATRPRNRWCRHFI